MARLPALDPANLAPEQRAVYDKIANSPRGGVRGPFLALIHAPEMCDRLQHLGEYLRYKTAFEARLSEMAIDLQGAAGLAWDRELWGKEDWIGSWLSAPTGRLAGGADEMLLNTIAEKILGLPQDHRPDKGVPFNRIPV